MWSQCKYYFLRAYHALSHDGFGVFQKKLKRFILLKIKPLKYKTWYKKQIQIRYTLAQHDAQLPLYTHTGPKISIVIPVCDPQPSHLTQALDSVVHQFYTNWELCIADDFSSNKIIRDILSQYARSDARIKILFRSERGHISEASNSALSLTTGDYIGFLDHDDELEKDALYWVAKTILAHPSSKLIYSDEDHRNPEGTLHLPYFKPDWNKDLLLSQNYICHFMVISRSVITQLKGFNSQYNGAQDYDFVLRASELCHDAEIQHIPFVLYHWREHAGSTAMAIGAKPYAMEAGRRAVADHLQRLEISATVLPAPDAPAWNRIRYTIPKPAPLVSIIIPTRNRCDLLKTCIDSIRRANYKNFEILVIDNGSDQPNDLVYLDSLMRENIAKVLRLDIPFNYARLNNLGVQHTSGKILLFMNNDIEAIDTEWLGEIVSNTLRKEIGIVGARLWYPDFTLQHGGVIIGMGGLAGHAFYGLPQGSAGYFGRAILQQNFSAVTGACMAFRREVFEQVGGFDEIFVVSMNDVDICLRVLQLGLKITWTPFAALIHHESASRGQDDTPEKLAVRMHECALFEKRWKDILLTDPAYNPNLSLETSDFALSHQPRLEKFMPAQILEPSRA
jgi:O-antigen biosynthesis protein